MRDRLPALLILVFGLLIIAYAVTSMWFGKNPVLSTPMAIAAIAFGVLLTVTSTIAIFRRESE